MKIVNGVRIHTIELTDQAINTIHRLATLAMAPHQALLDEIAPQLPQQPQPSAPPPAPDLPPLPEGADYVRHQNGMPNT